MGCGCGGRKGAGSRRSVAPPARSLQAGVNARQVQVQSNQRQALVQRAKEQLQQQGSNSSDPNKEVERKRRIQVSLRNRYMK